MMNTKNIIGVMQPLQYQNPFYYKFSHSVYGIQWNERLHSECK